MCIESSENGMPAEGVVNYGCEITRSQNLVPNPKKKSLIKKLSKTQLKARPNPARLPIRGVAVAGMLRRGSAETGAATMLFYRFISYLPLID